MGTTKWAKYQLFKNAISGSRMQNNLNTHSNIKLFPHSAPLELRPGRRK